MSTGTEQGRGERICLVVAYDGAGFHGFARQTGLRTVQGVLEDTLSDMLGMNIEVHGSGRTDKGVHARAQVIHFDLAYGPTADRMVHVLRRRLPSDIIPVSTLAVDSTFHARFSVVKKSYRYRLHLAPLPDVFTYRFSWHIREALSLPDMLQAATAFVGTHDFTSFCAAASPLEDKVRTVTSVNITRQGDELVLDFEGTGFLQYMVRIMVGTLVDVGLGTFRPTAVADMLYARDRTKAGRTAPPHGLTLWNVEYPIEYGGKVLDPTSVL